MIKFHKVRFKNFLSTGDSFTEITLNKKPTTLVIGPNGSGKSTVLDALTFSLFGKAFRKVNKTALINSINKKNAVVEVEFSIGRNQYRVMRAIKPNKFEIYLNGNLIHQDANVRDYQAILEQQILKLNYKSFTQVVVLGSSSFTPFMQLNTIERRGIIEDILDIQIFSVMNDILKQRYSALRHELNEIKTNIKIGKEKIKSQEETMHRLEKNRDEQIINLKNTIEDSDEQEALFMGSIDILDRKLEEQNDQKSDEDVVREKLQQILGEERQFETDRKKFLKELKFYENNDNCPTCKQDIESEHKEHICADTTKNIEEILEKLLEREKQVEDINDRLLEIRDINQEISRIQSDIQKEQNQITAGQRYRKKLERELRDLEGQEHTEEDTEKLNRYRKAYKQLEGMEETLIDKRHYYDLAEILLRDSGIKTKIIRQYLPIMNKLINKYLASM